MSAAACILANISMGLGRSLQWDHAKGVIVNDAEANKLLRRPVQVTLGASGSEGDLASATSLKISVRALPP